MFSLIDRKLADGACILLNSCTQADAEDAPYVQGFADKTNHSVIANSGDYLSRTTCRTFYCGIANIRYLISVKYRVMSTGNWLRFDALAPELWSEVVFKRG